MIEEQVITKLRAKYANIHPLIFTRSVERAKSPGDLFDILEAIPQELPVVWSEEEHRWVTTDDLTQSKKFEVIWNE